MNSQKLNDWLQIVGLFGVIGSLIFVGLQLRQTQAIALSETYQNRTTSTIDMNSAVISSPAALSGISKIYSNKFGDLTMQEAVALEYVIGNVLTTMENNQLQYQSGFLSQEHWDRNLDELKCILTVPLFREIATGWPFRNSFHNVIADALQEVSLGAENCWTYSWDFPTD